MQSVTNHFIPVFRYVYLVAFFALTAGIFHPIVKGYGVEYPIIGIFILFIGMSGGAILSKTYESKHPEIMMGMGFGLIGFSLYLIFDLLQLI